MFRSARPTARCTLLALVLPLLAAVTLAAATAPTHAAPAGFAIENLPFTGLDQPTTVEFAATGQVFVAERRGVIKVFDNLDDASSPQVADLRLRVYNNGDRGLLGMALDPATPAAPTCGPCTPRTPTRGRSAQVRHRHLELRSVPVRRRRQRLPSHRRAHPTDAEPDDRTLDRPGAGAARRLVPAVRQPFGRNRQFGADGYLYVSSGDGASYNQVDTGNLGASDAQTLPAKAVHCVPSPPDGRRTARRSRR